MGKYIDGSGLTHFMGILKGAFAAKADAVKSITRSGTTFTATRADGTTFTFTQQDSTVAKTTTAPKMDGTAAVGTETKYAAGDHVHPTDTTRVPTARKVNGKALSADIVLDGTDIMWEGAGETVQEVIDDLKDNKVDKVTGKGLSTNDYTTAEKTKLSGIATGAEVNQNAFSNVKVGSTTVAADAKTDTLELVAGSNVTLTPDATNDKVTIAATDTNTTYTLTQDASDGHKITLTPSSGDATTITIPDSDTKALGSMTGTLGVAHGGTGATTLGAGVVYHSASGTGALSIATAANLVSALGNTAVNRATADASGNNIASTYATKSELSTATAGALQYKGAAAKESDISGAAYKKGWYYVVSAAGTYFGSTCEAGDMLIAKQDKTATPANDWDAVQSNIEVLSNDEIDALWAAA